MSSPVSDISMDFDAKNRVISVMSSGLGNLSTYPSTTLNYGYDANDNLTSMTSSLGSTNYNYDPLNRLVSLTNRLGEQFSWSYDNASRLTNESRPGTSTVYTYNAQALLESITHRTSSSIKSQLSYLYDQNNQPIQKSTTLGVFNYAYDNNGQLVSATHPTLTQEQFSYDPLGNRIADQNGNYVYDYKAQQLKEDYLFEYFYDANGNLIQKLPKDPTHKAFVYNYSSTNQLIELSITDGATGPRILHIKYTYDALGRRMQKEVINSQEPAKSYTKKYVYNGDNVLLEYDAQNDLIAEYTHSPLRPDDILAAHISAEGVNAQLAKTEGSYFYLKDHLGSVTEITNSAGNILQKYDYASFGKLNKITDEAGNDITDSPLLATTYTYTGRELEKESGLYYYRARFYDSAIGRFLQVDPDPGRLSLPITTINKYIYVGNNPINRIDPTGKNWFGDLLVGAAAFAVAFFAGPFIAAAILGAGASSLAFAAVSIVAGAAVGGIIGGLTNVSIGNGTFGDGFRIGAAAGALGGYSGGSYFYSFRQNFLYEAREILFNLSFGNIKNLLPLSAAEATGVVLSLSGFTYDQVTKSCEEGKSYDWKTNKCQNTKVPIPLPSPEI